MQHPMRRKDRALPPDETRALFDRCEYTFLSTVGKDGQPYAIPISYVVMDGIVYIHCALKGRKVDNLAFCPKVCLTVVGATEPVYDGGFTTFYESAVVEGTARLVTSDDEKRRSLTALAEKYLPAHMDKLEESLTKHWKATLVYAVSIDQISGKSRRKKPVIAPDA